MLASYGLPQSFFDLPRRRKRNTSEIKLILQKISKRWVNSYKGLTGTGISYDDFKGLFREACKNEQYIFPWYDWSKMESDSNFRIVIWKTFWKAIWKTFALNA